MKKGDLLYTIDARPYQTELARAEAALAQANANLGFAGRDAERSKQLFATGVITGRAYDSDTSNFEQLTAATRVSVASVAAAKLNVAYASLYAPISGRVGRTFVTPGNLVTADAAGATDDSRVRGSLVRLHRRGRSACAAHRSGCSRGRECATSAFV